MNEIVSFADRHLAPYKIRGSQIVPLYCPICKGGGHDRNTFALNIDNGLYKCQRGSCGATGRVQTLFSYFGESAQSIKREYGGVKRVSQKFSLPKTQLFLPTDDIISFFANRHISVGTMAAFKIASDKFGNIVFPFYNEGVLEFVKFRKTVRDDKCPKEWREQNTKSILFNMDNCTFEQPLVITQGQIDAMSVYESGYENVVSVPSGCDDMDWIEHCYDWLERFNTFILFGDSDAPGVRMIEQLTKRLDESKCKVVRIYPTDMFGTKLKDANEILSALGKEAVIACIDAAEQIEISGMIDIGDVQPYDPLAVNRIAFGIPAVDEMLGGMEEGCITIISGRSGQGKSTLTNQFILNTVQQGKRVVVYSGELKKDKLTYWLCLQAAGSDYVGLKYDPIKDKKVPSITWQVQRRVTDWLRGNVFLFDNEQTRPNGEKEIDTVLRLFTIMARKSNPFLFVIDNVMSLLADQSEEIPAQRSMIVRLKSFAQRFKCHIVLIAHPRKSGSGEDKVLSKDSVSGSSSMVNFCDSAFSVERPNIRILKNRDGGTSRLIECCYMSDCRRIYQMDKGDVFGDYNWDKSNCPVPDVKANTIYGITFADTQPF